MNEKTAAVVYTTATEKSRELRSRIEAALRYALSAEAPALFKELGIVRFGVVHESGLMLDFAYSYNEEDGGTK